MSLLHSSTRRPAALKPSDYDHEISLIDSTASNLPTPSPRSQSVNSAESSFGPVSDSSSRRHSDVPLRHKNTLRKELTRRKYKKYQERQQDVEGVASRSQTPALAEEERGRPVSKKQHEDHESAIDILFENQRGGFLCGIALFSAKALGGLDAAPWTNVAQKPSMTDITNAQVPDPSWEWAWREWTVNHQEEVDEDGWEYSFAYWKKLSWHGPTWWNSCVRRRAWTRKRVKKHTPFATNEAHMLNDDYFTIHPASVRSRSRSSTVDSRIRNRYSITQLAKREMEEDIIFEDIHDIHTLMQTLKHCRIDREKMEAVESFIEHGGDELYYLRERMHDIMGSFIFQASRRLLLTHLLKIFNEAQEANQSDDEKSDQDPIKKRRCENLAAALKHADEEVRRLEFWSDVKDMAEKGDTKGAIDESQGWNKKEWTGLDDSGPRDVISNRQLPGMDNCKDDEGNGTAISMGSKSEEKRKEMDEH